MDWIGLEWFYSQTGNSLNLDFDSFYRRGWDGIGMDRTGAEWIGLVYSPAETGLSTTHSSESFFYMSK